MFCHALLANPVASPLRSRLITHQRSQRLDQACNPLLIRQYNQLENHPTNLLQDPHRNRVHIPQFNPVSDLPHNPLLVHPYSQAQNQAHNLPLILHLNLPQDLPHSPMPDHLCSRHPSRVHSQAHIHPISPLNDHPLSQQIAQPRSQVLVPADNLV